MKEMIMKALGTLAAAPGTLAGWSDEHKQFYSSGYRCPQCNERLMSSLGTITVNFYSDKRELIPLWKMAVYRADFAGCPKCNYLWKVKGTNQPDAPRKFEILGIIETDRMEENIGTDKRTIDNSMSSVKLKRKFTISKQWAKTYSLEYEKVQVENSGLTIGIDKLDIKTGFEETIRKQFAISEETQEVYSEEVEIDVPGSTKLNVLFYWKRIWQCGFIRFRNQNVEELKIPFRVAVGVTFDQLQFDENK